MTILDEIKRFNRQGLLFKEVRGPLAIAPNGYIVNRWYFRGAFLVLLLSIAFYAVYGGFGLTEHYVSCPTNTHGYCWNPYYHACNDEWCWPINNQELFFPGETYGKEPLNLYGLWLAFSVALATAFVANHLHYNLRKK